MLTKHDTSVDSLFYTDFNLIVLNTIETPLYLSNFYRKQKGKTLQGVKIVEKNLEIAEGNCHDWKFRILLSNKKVYLNNLFHNAVHVHLASNILSL